MLGMLLLQQSLPTTMKKVVNKKDYRVVIIPKNTYRLNYKEPSLTRIRQAADVWNLKEEDIIETVEFSSSYHIKIKAKVKYIYDYSGFKKYEHYYREYHRKHPEKDKKSVSDKRIGHKKSYYQEHKEKLKEYYKKYYQEHREYYLERNKINYIKRKERKEIEKNETRKK